MRDYAGKAGLDMGENAVQATLNPQKNLNGEVHNWYRIVLGFSDKLVAKLLDEFSATSDDLVIDPFCGTGTTLVECMKRELGSVGIDASPSCCFAARVKTNWQIKRTRVLELLCDVRHNRHKYLRRKQAYKTDVTYRYIEDSGMLKRGWISDEPLRRSIAIKHCISDLRTTSAYKNVRKGFPCES